MNPTFTNQPTPLSTTEFSMIDQLLSEAANEFPSNSCNDFFLPATPENVDLVDKVTRHMVELGASAPEVDPEDALEYSQESSNEVFSYDDWMARYFADQCASILNNTRQEPLFPHELEAIAEVLRYLAGIHAGHAESGVGFHDLTLSANDDNRALAESVIAHGAMPTRQTEFDKLNSDDDEIVIPDDWVAMYLSERCLQLAGKDSGPV